MWDISIENRIESQFYWINYSFIANITFPLATSCWARKEKVCFDLTKKILNFLPSWGRQRHFSFRQMLENTAKNTWILVHQVYFQEINIKFHIMLYLESFIFHICVSLPSETSLGVIVWPIKVWARHTAPDAVCLFRLPEGWVCPLGRVSVILYQVVPVHLVLSLT